MLSRELPVSGLEVRIEAPTGVEDLLLQEVRALDTRLMFHLFENLITVAKHSSPNWAELTVTDLANTVCSAAARDTRRRGPGGNALRLNQLRRQGGRHFPHRRTMSGKPDAAHPSWSGKNQRDEYLQFVRRRCDVPRPQRRRF